MPSRAQQVCNQPGCNALTDGRYCQAHIRDNSNRDMRQLFDKMRADDPFRALYRTAQWFRTRAAVLARDPVCKECKRAASTVVDHIVRAVIWVAEHANGPASFFDLDNLQGLCVSCHNSKTAKEVHANQRA